MIGGNSYLSQIASLGAIPYTFQLTGSRHFGKATVVSDWDFFVQDDGINEAEDTPSLRLCLRAMGFNVHKGINGEYQDSQTVEVWRWKSVGLIGGQIDIQIVKDFNKKLLAQNAIMCLYGPTFKEQGVIKQRLAWEAFFEHHDAVSNPNHYLKTWICSKCGACGCDLCFGLDRDDGGKCSNCGNNARKPRAKVPPSHQLSP